MTTPEDDNLCPHCDLAEDQCRCDGDELHQKLRALSPHRREIVSADSTMGLPRLSPQVKEAR